jgi:hypothetical protein
MEVPMPPTEGPHSEETGLQPSDPATFPLVTALGVFGILSTFVLLVFLMYAINDANRPAPPPATDKTPLQKLAELRAEDRARQEGYGWNDKANGIVSIPIAEAMKKLADGGGDLKGSGAKFPPPPPAPKAAAPAAKDAPKDAPKK